MITRVGGPQPAEIRASLAIKVLHRRGPELVPSIAPPPDERRECLLTECARLVAERGAGRPL